MEETSQSEKSRTTISYCRRCDGPKNHIVVASEDEGEEAGGIIFRTTFDLLRCLGCDAVSVRREDFCDSPAIVYPGEGWGRELDDSEGRRDYDYWPGVVKRPLPEWIGEISNPFLKDTLVETYKAFDNDLPILAAAGTRTVFDLLADQLLGRDAGSFQKKLDALFDDGHISKKQKDILHSVIDAGSAAQHRAYRVPHYDLVLILSVIEGVLHQTMLAEEKAAALGKRTPKRKMT